ncbi:MAG TPA: hypothetical protein VLQ29_03155 [Candidatus Dormibacteraeota bacterium]|nr:hypothetical protein [Candidatus Dormibacteraeota bacterium]
MSSVSIVDTVTHAESSNNIINTVRELRAALRACWGPPNIGISRANMTISVRMSFKHNGEILGIPLITYTSLGISEDERQAYRAALDETLARCAPLPFSDAFGSVIAGRPINMRFH